MEQYGFFKKYTFIFIWLLAFCEVQGGNLAVTLTASQKSVYDVTTYSFVLSGTQTLTDSCVIIFTFPLSSGISYQAPISCTVGNGFRKTPTCTASGGITSDLVVQAACTSTGTIDTTSPSLYNINIVNMKNSFSAQSITTIKVQTRSASTLIDEGFGSITFLPKVLPASWGKLLPADPSVGVYNELKLQLTITTQVPYDGQIILVIPKWDSQGKKSMADQVASCTASSDLSGNSPTCVAAFNQPKTNFDQVTVKNAMLSYQTSGYVPSGKLLEIAIKNLRNPPTLQTYNTYEIYTADINGNLIETCSGLSLFLLNVGSLDRLSGVTLKGNTGINQMGTYNFFFKLGNPIPAGGWVRVVFPTELTVVSPVFNPLVQISSSATITQQTITLNGVSKVAIDIKNGITAYVQDSSAILFEISGIKNPSSTKVTGSFEFYTSDSLNSWIDKLSTGLTIQAIQGSLRSVKVYPSDSLGVLQYAKVYQLQFTTTNTLTSANSIIIKFPSASFTVSSRTCTVNGTFSGQKFPSSSYSCIAASDSQTVTIKNFISTTLSSSTTFSLTIQNLYIRNPPIVSDSSPIEVYTALDGNRVDYDNSQRFKATWSPITTASVVASSYQTNQNDVTYTITMVPSGYLVQNAVINITFPDEIAISDQTKLTNLCGQKKLSGFKNSIDCQIKNTNQVLIRNGFTSSLSDDPPTLILSLPGIKNPRSQGTPTSSFQISVYEGLDSKLLLYNISSGVSISMTSVSSIISVQLQRDSIINGDITNITFKIRFQSQVVKGDYLIIDVPKVNPIFFSRNTKCYGISSNLFYNQICSIGPDNSLKIEFQTRFLRRYLQSGRQQQANFIVTNIQNPKSLQRTSSFVITQYNLDGQKVEISTQNITVQNNQSAELNYSQVIIAPSSMQTSLVTPYIVSFAPKNYVADMFISIKVPPEIKVPDKIQCEGISGVSLDIQCDYVSTNRTLFVKNAFQQLSEPKLIKFSIQNLTNPATEIKTANFLFQTFTSDNFALDSRDKDLYLDFKCSLPCKTCLPSNNTACGSCFTDLLRGLPIHLYEKYCIAECPKFTYAKEKTLECKACYDKNACVKCTDGGEKSCKQCVEDYTLINGQCVKVNDQTYFYPVLILSIVWLLSCIFITLNWEKSRYLTTAIIGLSILEIIMLGIELAMQAYYKFSSNLNASLIYGFALQYPSNIAFGIFYFVFLKNFDEIKESRIADKKLHLTILLISGLLNQRAFKLLYSNLGNKPYLSIDTIFQASKIRRTYYIVQLLSILPSLLLAVNAFQNMALAQTMKLRFPQDIDVERIGLSFIVCILMCIELCYLQKPRPHFVENAISKYHGEQPNGSAIGTQRLSPKKDLSQYNEIPSMSFATQQDGPPSLLHQDEQLKRQAMKQVLDNLKLVKPELIEERIQELLQEKHGKMSPLRKSDQPISIAKRQAKTSRYKQNAMEEDGEDERRVHTEPPSPKVGDKVTGGMIEEIRNLEAFPMDPKIKVDMKDQEVAAGRNSIDREWEELQKEKFQLTQMREEFEKEKTQFKLNILEERKRSQGSTPMPLSDRTIDEANRKEIYTHRSKNQMLDAVRESQSELLEDHHGKKIRQKTHSKDRFNPHTLSLNSESPSRLTQSRHKCHGQSHSTIKSIQNLRMKTGSSKSGSINGSQFNPSQIRIEQQTNDNMFTSPKNLQQYLNSNLDDEQHIQQPLDNSSLQLNRQTRIYYSDKTESSVEELMDETPSAYNLPNGRFEGKSQGGNVFLLQNNQAQQKIIARVNHNKQTQKKKNKLFREETTQEVETITEYQMEGQVDSRSQSVARFGQQRINQLQRAEGAVSTMSFENQQQKSVLKTKRGSVGMRVDGIIPMSTDRIKALEAAYLTKLQRPKKTTPRSRQYDQAQLERNYTEIINIHKQKSTLSQREGLNIQSNPGLNELGLTQMKVLPVPQINNFNK